MLESLFSRFETIVVLDTETTGVNCRTDEIIELGTVTLRADGAEREEDYLIRLSPGRHLSEEIVRLTGITEERLLSDGVEKRAAAEALCRALREPSPLVVAYNAQFDLCFLYYFLARQGMADALKRAKFLDALAIYKDRRDYPHKLCDAVEAYHAEAENTHRASDDAKAALEVLKAMGEERDDLDRYINLFGYNPKYGVPRPRIGSIRYEPQPYRREKLLYE